MKAGRISRSLIFLALGVVCMFFSFSSGAQASDYIGTYCWQSSVDGTVYEFAINDMGNFHYLLNGRIILPGGSILPMSGSGEVGEQGGNVGVYIAFSGGSFGSSSTQTFSINWALSPATLNGTGAGIMSGSNYQGEAFANVIQDDLVFVFCP